MAVHCLMWTSTLENHILVCSQSPRTRRITTNCSSGFSHLPILLLRRRLRSGSTEDLAVVHSMVFFKKMVRLFPQLLCINANSTRSFPLAIWNVRTHTESIQLGQLNEHDLHRSAGQHWLFSRKCHSRQRDRRRNSVQRILEEFHQHIFHARVQNIHHWRELRGPIHSIHCFFNARRGRLRVF